MRRAFIHHEGALGDVLLSLPCISAIRAKSPFLHLATRDDVGRFLVRAGCIDAASPSGSGRYVSLYTGDGMDEGLRGFLKQFDEVFVFSAERHSPVARSIGEGVISAKVILTRPALDVRMHVAEFRIRQIGIPINNGDPFPLLDVPGERKACARETLVRKGWDGSVPVIVIHPGSGGGHKNWPVERYRELIWRIREGGDYFLVTLSGPAEDPETRRVMEAIAERDRGGLQVADAALVDVAALISLSTVYVGNDSGITHLAGAMDTPACVLFGPTDPLLWRPLGHRVRIVTPHAGRDIASIPMEEVYRTIGELLKSGDGPERGDAIGA